MFKELVQERILRRYSWATVDKHVSREDRSMYYANIKSSNHTTWIVDLHRDCKHTAVTESEFNGLFKHSAPKCMMHIKHCS